MNTQNNTIETNTTNINVVEFLKTLETLNLPKGKFEKIKTLAVGLFGNDLELNPILLSRTLLALGLSVKEAAGVMGVDSADINSNNNPRVKLGDPKKVLTLSSLRINPRYNKPFTEAQFNALSVKFPKIKDYSDRVLVTAE